MSHKFTIYEVGGVHVISDDGHIGRLLQLSTVVPWELVATSPDMIAEKIKQMELLLRRATEISERGLIPMPTCGSGSISGAKPISASDVLKSLPPGSQPIETLPVHRRYILRLKMAGISTIGQLAGTTEAQLRRMVGVGDSTITNAKAGMRALGYRLAKKIGDPSDPG